MCIAGILLTTIKDNTASEVSIACEINNFATKRIVLGITFANRMNLLQKVASLIAFSILYIDASQAQTALTPNLELSGFAEAYYSYDFSKPTNNQKVAWLYNHKLHNTFSINHAFIKLAYKQQNVRANLAAMAGNYAQYNLSAEPTWAQFIYEANIGIKLSKQHNLWLDAGVLNSHIGFESAANTECLTLTRSIVAENSPYYESGAKLNYTSKNEKLFLALLALNGWQRIERLTGSSKLNAGAQITYKPNKHVVLNYSNFVGSVQVDANNAIRTYHNFYAQYNTNKKWQYILGIDYGRDKASSGSYENMFTASAIAQYKIHKQLAIAGRVEYYHDPKETFIATGTNGFQTIGSSINLDYDYNANIKCRIESKMYKGKGSLFFNGSDINNNVTANITVRF
jgi:hypothetical protein